MQSDAWLIKYIERSHQAAAQRGCQVDALRLTAGQGVREPVESQVGEAHIHQEAQVFAEFPSGSLPAISLSSPLSIEVSEELMCLADGHG
ncbi:MAG: hypothetical protein MZV63_00570 [Marinilabiliales bacterium]|nr:hypothetical protein [Marinilabiliales bacterium]